MIKYIYTSVLLFYAILGCSPFDQSVNLIKNRISEFKYGSFYISLPAGSTKSYGKELTTEEINQQKSIAKLSFMTQYRINDDLSVLIVGLIYPDTYEVMFDKIYKDNMIEFNNKIMSGEFLKNSKGLSTVKLGDKTYILKDYKKSDGTHGIGYAFIEPKFPGHIFQIGFLIKNEGNNKINNLIEEIVKSINLIKIARSP